MRGTASAGQTLQTEQVPSASPATGLAAFKATALHLGQGPGRQLLLQR